MANRTFARLDANNIMAEPTITLPDTVNVALMFAPTITVVDVSGFNPQPNVGDQFALTDGEWTAAKLPPPAPVPNVPMQISMFQAKAVLLNQPGTQAGKTLLDEVDAWVPSQSPLLQLAWSTATIVTRNGSFVSAGAAQFGWSKATLDGLFIAGAQISI